jgi:hypothetical protein
MTAEIAILNKHGIALAADSKVTIGSAGEEKTFDTVNKLFTLSKVHPIALMIYGNAEFMRYPWETIAKIYRQQKGAKGEKTVAVWADDFCRYISKFGNIRPEDRSRNVQNVVGSVFDNLQTDAFKEARQKNISVPSKDYVALLLKNVQQEIIKLQRIDDFFNEEQKIKFIAGHAADIDQSVNEFFQAFDDVELVAKARELALLSIFKKQFSPQSSGVVIAGFGNDEMFPALVEFETDGYVGDELKLFQTRRAEITRDNASAIFPFAQKEMVQRFMNGIDPELAFALQKILVPAMIQNSFDVLEQYGAVANKNNDNVRQQIRDAANAAVRATAATLGRIQRNAFSTPIIQMVSLLPKDELPHLAESLVALTSLKRHVSRDAETVGGPIDVCLISKGDGFIWIKRKHYFKPELNPQFTRNYMRGISSPGEGHERQGTRKATRTTRRANKKTSSAPAGPGR